MEANGSLRAAGSMGFRGRIEVVSWLKLTFRFTGTMKFALKRVRPCPVFSDISAFHDQYLPRTEILSFQGEGERGAVLGAEAS